MRTFDLNINLNLDCFPYLITWFTNLDTREPQGMLDYVTPILNQNLNPQALSSLGNLYIRKPRILCWQSFLGISNH